MQVTHCQEGFTLFVCLTSQCGWAEFGTVFNQSGCFPPRALSGVLCDTFVVAHRPCLQVTGYATEQSGKLLYLRKVFENNSRQSVWARANTDFRLGQPCPALQQHVTDQRRTSVKMTDMQDDGAN